MTPSIIESPDAGLIGARLGFGCMRLSTRDDRNDERSIAVIHAALDAGVTLLDTADAYGRDDAETGHNERLIARALAEWGGDRSRIVVASKGGLRRPGGKWLPDGRAVHLRAACDASRAALGVECIDLYQLHVVDPRTSLETSVRALAALRESGRIARIGLCNVTVAQIEKARSITSIDAVQVLINPFDDENLRNGVAEYCRDHGLLLIAYRPFAGDQHTRIAKDQTMLAIAARHAVSPYVATLAWLRDLAPALLPVPGTTQVEHARALRSVLGLELDDQDRARLDARFEAGRILRVPRAARAPAANATGEVVIVMGMPGAGKSTRAQQLVEQGHLRLNRDERGGRLRGLVDELDAALAAGERHFVLDNTYAARSARNEVIECAWRHGVPARCIWVNTSIADAQINAVERMIAAHGRLPTPEEIRQLGRTDHRFFGPDAQFRYERELEPPTLAEGFSQVEESSFERSADRRSERAVVIEFDDVLAIGRPLSAANLTLSAAAMEQLRDHHGAGFTLFAIAWRPEGKGNPGVEEIERCFTRARELLALPIEFAYCPHPAGPPVCWCRKPLPGLLLDFAQRQDVALERSLLIGKGAADRTLATRLRMEYRELN